MENLPYLEELRVAIKVAQQAAKLGQSVLKATDKGVVEKDDLSPVTVADFAIQALLTTTVHHAFETDRFVGEESASELRRNPVLLDRVWTLLNTLADDKDAKLPSDMEQMCQVIDWCGDGTPGGEGSGRAWVFDPIDGTKTFVRGEAYAINMALLEDGKQILGVVACPTIAVPVDLHMPISNDTVDATGQGCLLFAVKGHGTWVCPLFPSSSDSDKPRKIDAHASTATLESLRSVSCLSGTDSGVNSIHKLVTEELGAAFPGCDLLGWVPRWATMALGLANMTIWVYKKRERTGKVWDHAGAMLLFEEVGGKITDIDGKDIDLSIGRKMTENHGFIAAPRHLHQLILEKVHRALKDDGKEHLLGA